MLLEAFRATSTFADQTIQGVGQCRDCPERWQDVLWGRAELTLRHLLSYAVDDPQNHVNSRGAAIWPDSSIW